MSVSVMIYPEEVDWNGNTWDINTGGPLFVRYGNEARAVEDRWADAEYPPFVAMVDKSVRANLRLREFKQTLDLGDMDDLVMTCNDGKSTQSVVTISNAVLQGVNGSVSRANPGESEVTFIHQSSDGFTNPVN